MFLGRNTNIQTIFSTCRSMNILSTLLFFCWILHTLFLWVSLPLGLCSYEWLFRWVCSKINFPQVPLG
jgi:hypothetical protein